MAGDAGDETEGRTDSQSGAVVLVVEDDLDAAAALRIVLEGDGYRVLHACSAEEGLQAAREQRPDLILLDVMMPSGTEGFHLVWELRRDPDPRWRELPIIVLSAIHRTMRVRLHPDQGNGVYQPGEFLPVQGFLDKPVSFARLLDTIRGALAAQREQRDTQAS